MSRPACGGGWLTEYYPQAETNITADDVRLDHPLRKDLIGTLLWRNLEQVFLAALTNKGLYEDEAGAMLETWEAAYFKTPGTRLFFIVLRAWVDHYLPLEVSIPAKIERVMVGRIELLSKISAEAQPQVIN
jgi:hypothetical protein